MSSFAQEFASRNFSLYGQWFGIASIILLVILGAVKAFTVNIAFAIIGWVFAFVLVFVEVPFCTKFCPTSPRFDNFIARSENSYFRTGLYLVFSIVMFLSNLVEATVLNVPAVTLLLGGLSYGIAAVKNQPHASTKILGGTGVDNVV